ncbi:MAG: membrane protein insertase YidC, partial [Tateyamaria sp.]
MDDQNKNLILATALSFLVILLWFVLFPPPEPDIPLDATAPAASTADSGDSAVPAAPPISGEATTAPATQTATADPTADAPRVAIDTARLSGSISLAG